ncbi:MAG: hypothetical protein L3J29_09925 [Cyclobacteriaceae bacterium]|nr:hypothetical protein [Cyclobacteriaceae bacterium]
MRNIIYIGVFFAGLIFFLFMMYKPLTPQQYIKWVEGYENGWHQKTIYNDWIIDVQKQPLPYVALNRYGVTISDEDLDFFLKEQQEEQYYIFNIARNDGKDLIEYFGEDQRKSTLNYFSFTFQKAIKLSSNGKEISPNLFHFERDNNLSNSRSFLLSFNKPPKEGLTTLIINSPLLSPTPIKIPIEGKKTPAFTL